MRRLSTGVERHIAGPHDVWAYRLDFLPLPEYNPSVRRLEQLAARLEADGRTASVPPIDPGGVSPAV